MVIGFVDRIVDIPKTSNSLIAKIDDKESQMGKSNAVVRLFCNDDAKTFYQAFSQFEVDF